MRRWFTLCVLVAAMSALAMAGAGSAMAVGLGAGSEAKAGSGEGDAALEASRPAAETEATPPHGKQDGESRSEDGTGENEGSSDNEGSSEHKGPSENDRTEAEADGGTSAEGGGAEAGAEDSGSLSSLVIGGGSSTSEEFDVPVALLPVYQACGSRYGISWEVLAAINKIETGFGTNLGTSGAGAEGWMQFLPSTWKQWGIDGDGDGRADSGDPVDAICSAARYLAASGGEEDIYAAVFAYNHADWYVREVLAQAQAYERVPANLINSLTALAGGSTVPVSGKVSSSSQAESVTIDAASGAMVHAVVAGTVVEVADDARGRYVVLSDAYGDRFVYRSLASVSVSQGAVVEAGAALGRAGDEAIVFSVRPAGSSPLDPTELLEIWRRGGVGKIYAVDVGQAGDGVAAATEALLMSADALRAAVLADADLDLPRCVREAVAGGELGRQSLATLEYLTARGYQVGVAGSTCSRRSGLVLEIDSVGGAPVRDNQGQGTRARALVRTALAMEGSQAPQRVVSETALAGSSSGDRASGTIELDYRPPQKARLVDGEAIAPVGAPAAVQEIIAAANQINETPYVWGGGHGSWAAAGYDCSGAVSYVLHAAGMLSTPLTSGALESWGDSGTGKWVTVYANSGHTYAVIAGLRWDTVGDVSGSGPRWHTEGAYPAGFSIRHPAGY